MKILHVIPSIAPESGGPAQAIIPMCRTLREQGLVVLLVTTNVGLTKEVTRGNTTVFKNIPALFFSSQWGESFKFSRPMANWLDENVNQFDAVHIHAVFNHACVAAARACRQHHVPYVVRPLGSLDPWSLKQKRLRKQLFWQLQGERMLRDAAAVHYTTQSELIAAEEHLHLSNGTVIPLGVDAVKAQWPPSASERVSYQLDGNPFVLALSRLHPKKAFDVLIDAFVDNAADERLRHWQLIIAGQGDEDYMNLLLRKVRERNAHKHVFFTGWLDGETKWQLLRQASLLVLPSYQENFGMCVLESLSCGVPVIVSPHVNLAEQIRVADAGWITPVDRQALSLTLKEALSSPDLRSQKGKAGQALAREYVWPRIARELVELYSRIIVSPNVRSQVVA